MIETLAGRVLATEPALILQLGPVTLRLEISRQTRARLPEPGGRAIVFAEFRLRDEQPELIGFATPEERRLYRLLIGVSGVGKRLALSILSELSVEDLARAVSLGDEKRLTRISGVGAKTASRLLLELGSKLAEFLPPEGAPPLAEAPADPGRQEALLALMALGMNRAAALQALARVGGGSLSVEEMIREALGASRAVD